MYISPREVADTRDHTLHNLLAASTAWLDAGERLTDLFARTGRDLIAHGGRQMEKLANGHPLGLPSGLWLNSLPYKPAQLFEEALDIIGATHSAVVQATQAQIRACDQLLDAAIDRAAQRSPWEGELALTLVKSTLKSAGNTLQNLTEAAIQTVEKAEAQVKQTTGLQAEEALAKPAPRSKKAQ